MIGYKVVRQVNGLSGSLPSTTVLAKSVMVVQP